MSSSKKQEYQCYFAQTAIHEGGLRVDMYCPKCKKEMPFAVCIPMDVGSCCDHTLKPFCIICRATLDKRFEIVLREKKSRDE